jgi:hypothetical protein
MTPPQRNPLLRKYRAVNVPCRSNFSSCIMSGSCRCWGSCRWDCTSCMPLSRRVMARVMDSIGVDPTHIFTYTHSHTHTMNICTSTTHRKHLTIHQGECCPHACAAPPTPPRASACAPHWPPALTGSPHRQGECPSCRLCDS